MTQPLNEKELAEILELAQETEQAAKEMCEVISQHSKKWRLKAESHVEKAGITLSERG